MPHFTGQLEGPQASRDWVIGSGTEFVDRAAHAIGKAIEDHAAEREASPASRHVGRSLGSGPAELGIRVLTTTSTPE